MLEPELEFAVDPPDVYVVVDQPSELAAVDILIVEVTLLELVEFTELEKVLESTSNAVVEMLEPLTVWDIVSVTVLDDVPEDEPLEVHAHSRMRRRSS